MNKIQKLLLLSNILIIAIFAWYFGRSLNYEFLAYVLVIALVTLFIFGTLKYTKLSNGIILGITIWMLLHMLGGAVQVGDGVLYAYKISPFFDGGGDFYILKYDQIVHGFLYGVIGLIFLHFLRNILKVRTNIWLVAFIAIFASAGFSIINEIVEFLAVVNLPETGVGGYHNTVLDLIFNLSGSALFVITALMLRKNNNIN